MADTVRSLLKQARLAVEHALREIDHADAIRKTDGETEIGSHVTCAIINGYLACRLLRHINEKIERRKYLQRLEDGDEE